MTRKVFIVTNMIGGQTLTTVTTYDSGTRYVDHTIGEDSLLPTVIGNMGLGEFECEGVWIGELDDCMFDADGRGRDDDRSMFWAERRMVA